MDAANVSASPTTATRKSVPVFIYPPRDFLIPLLLPAAPRMPRQREINFCLKLVSGSSQRTGIHDPVAIIRTMFSSAYSTQVTRHGPIGNTGVKWKAQPLRLHRHA